MDYPQTAIIYAYRDNTGWHQETVASNVGSDTDWGRPALVLDDAGRPYIAFVDSVRWNLYLAHKEGTEWQAEAVASLWDGSGGLSLALDVAGHPHLSYYDSAAYALRYAHHDGTAWHFATLDTGLELDSGHTSLRLDGAGFPHISYFVVPGVLRYARFVGTAWITETVDLFLGTNGGFTSLALSPDGGRHISYYDDAAGDLKYAYLSCAPVQGASIVGPSFVPAGIPAAFHGLYVPITASLPITYTWNNGTIGLTAVYSWTLLGPQSLAVTLTGLCGEVSASTVITVFCQPVEEVEVTGPHGLAVGDPGLFTASYLPITTSPPITFTWDNGAAGPTAAYSWTLPGVYTPTVMATSRCGTAQGGQIVVVGYQVYLPTLFKSP